MYFGGGRVTQRLNTFIITSTFEVTETENHTMMLIRHNAKKSLGAAEERKSIAEGMLLYAPDSEK